MQIQIAALTSRVLVAYQAMLAMSSPASDLDNLQLRGLVGSSKTNIGSYSRETGGDASPAAHQFSCDELAYGLDAGDCNHMASIGMFAQGQNDYGDNGRVWIGADGPNTFVFINAAGVPIALIVWYKAPSDDAASFMNVRQPYISYSLPATGSAVEVSASHGVSGGFSGLYNRSTELTPYGQISNTLGEFTTGDWATVDVSRLVNMAGNAMTVEVFGGESSEPDCVADLQTCAYTCSLDEVQSCGEAGTYKLVNCDGPNAEKSAGPDGNPTGGCHGWSNGGRLEIALTW